MTQSNCCICDSNDWQTLYHKEVLHPLWWLNDNHKDLKLRYVICRNCEYIKLHSMLNEYEIHYRQSSGLTSRSQLIQSDIAKSANKLFPEIKNIRLYPLNG